eukprot:gb/GECG01013366.1/.p1 GENE.gb/GECG01013366.1/~~gb/GECG01013366.1/.p1  ORF type:complete len:897 (+),score=112.47 gb/GECG01013366.1/:1-2691(+)
MRIWSMEIRREEGDTLWDKQYGILGFPKILGFFKRRDHFCVGKPCFTPPSFEERFLTEFGKLPPYQSALHFSGIEVLYWSMQTCGCRSADEIRHALRNNMFPTVSGPMDFTDDHQNRGGRHMFVQYDKNDEYHIVSPDYLSSRRVILSVPSWKERKCARKGKCKHGDCQSDGSCSCRSGWIGSTCDVNLIPIVVTPSVIVFVLFISWQGWLYHRNRKLQEKQTEQEKRSKERELVESAARETHSRILSYALHELANPLFVVAEVLHTIAESGSAYDLHVAREKVSQMQRVLKDMQLSREKLQSGNLKLIPERVDASSLLRDVQHRLSTIHEVHTDLFFDGQCTDVSFFADGLRMRQLLTDVTANIARVVRQQELSSSGSTGKRRLLDMCIFVCKQICVVESGKEGKNTKEPSPVVRITPIVCPSRLKWQDVDISASREHLGSSVISTLPYISFMVFPRSYLRSLLGDDPCRFFQRLGSSGSEDLSEDVPEEVEEYHSKPDDVQIDVVGGSLGHLVEGYRTLKSKDSQTRNQFVADIMTYKVFREVGARHLYQTMHTPVSHTLVPRPLRLNNSGMTIAHLFETAGFNLPADPQPHAICGHSTQPLSPGRNNSTGGSDVTEEETSLATYGRRGPLEILEKERALEGEMKEDVIRSNFLSNASTYLDFSMNLPSCQNLAQRMGGSLQFTLSDSEVAAVTLPLFVSAQEIAAARKHDMDYDFNELLSAVKTEEESEPEETGINESEGSSNSATRSSEGPPTMSRSSNPSNSGRGNINVLICDDEKINVRLVRRMLKKLGISFGSVLDGDEVAQALQSASENNEPYDVILLDIVMKRTNGVDICQELRREHGDKIKIIAMTANATSEDISLYKTVGFDACLAKPFSRTDLEKCLNNEADFT